MNLAKYIDHAVLKPGMTQQAAADRLGMTQVQVSRRERVILANMRRLLTG